MAEVKTIQKSKNSSFKKKTNTRQIQVAQVKTFVNSFYTRYDRMMAKLSHE